MFDVDIQDVLDQYNYPLRKDKIANQPVFPRDHSKLLALNRHDGTLTDYFFYELADLLSRNDVLVLNETKVFSARLLGKKQSGGKVELLLIRQMTLDTFEAIAKPGLKPGQKLFFPRRSFLESDDSLSADLDFGDFLQALVISRDDDSAKVRVQFNREGDDLLAEIDLCGFTPLPPYIHSTQKEAIVKEEYQTVYAKVTGSAAAPTAGLHFTQALLHQLEKKGVQIEKIDLAVGLGTFAKLTRKNWENQELHQEYFVIDEAVAKRLTEAKRAGKRIVAVGTTSARALETALINYQKNENKSEKNKKNSLMLKSGKQSSKLFIHPPFKFAMVDALITNFHLPQSSLLMMVSAFTSQPNSPFVFEKFSQSQIGQAYQHAIQNDYRFFSFGDAMLIV